MANSNNDTKSVPNAEPPKPPASKEPPKKKKPFPRPPNKVDKSKLPQPKHLTISESALTNDPLWKDSFILDGETGVSNEDAAKEFEADAAGFVDLVELEYKDVDKLYAKAIPASLHAYYHTVFYWYKIALLAQRHDMATMDQERLIHFIKGYGGLKIASGAAEYLEGLGDFIDATGVKHLLTAQEPNLQGHFGQATAQTHSLYEKLPAPAIFLRRIKEDLQKTTDRFDDPGWMIPVIRPVARRPVPPPQDPQEPEPRQRRRRGQDLAPEKRDPDLRASEEDLQPPPDVAEANLPTVNLLGWAMPRTLTKNQLAEVQGALPDVEDFALVNHTYRVHRGLFDLAYRRLSEVRNYKLSDPPSSADGSMAQQATWRPCKPATGRFQRYVETPGQVISRTQLPVRVITAAKVFAYRTVRREFEDEDDEEADTNPWSCFDFDRYRDVPENWRQNRNISQYREGLKG